MPYLAFIIGAIAVLAAVLIGWHNTQLKTVKKTIETRRFPKEFDGLRIVIISDLHKKIFGKNNYRLIDEIKKQKPDMIFFPGDLISRYETSIKTQKSLICELLKVAPVYYTYGNHEVDADEEIRDEINDLGMTMLLNDSVRVEKNGGSINIAGVYFEPEFYKNKKGGYRNLPRVTCQEIKKRLDNKPDGFTFLLCHNPDYFPACAKWGADITVSGHIHGGVIRIGKIGLLHPERKLFPKYSSGVYKLGEKALVVSRGLGKFRINNAPEVLVLTIKTNTD